MRTMTFILAVVLAVAFARTAAETLAVSALPEPAFTDTEVSEDFAFRTGEAADGSLRIRMSLDAGTTNAFSVAFGTDADGDGRLAPDEFGLSFGWDCGAWFVRDEVAGWERTLSGTIGRCESVLRLRVGPDGRPVSLVLSSNDGENTLALGRGDLPSELFDTKWDRLRVTGRGGVSDVVVSVRAGGAGFAIRIR